MMPQSSIFLPCKRGIFGLSSWEPQRKPGIKQRTHGASQPPTNWSTGNGQRVLSEEEERRAEEERVVRTGQPPKNAKKLQAKYSYTANPNSPLGAEVSMKQGDTLTLVSDINSVWWLVQDGQGETGYAPASYLIVRETNADGLPWIQNKQPAQAAETQQEPMTTAFGRPTSNKSAAAKPYQSAYNRDQAADSKKYYCEICDKTLNGPKPYSSHMNSKAHREEEEYAKSMGRC